MALIQCPECGKEISDSAKACPNCGYPIAPVRHERGEKPSHGKYARRSNKKKWVLPVALGLFVICIVGVIVCLSMQQNKVEPSQNESTSALSAGQENEDIILTNESLKSYLDELGRVLQDENVEASTEFIDGLSSVYIMGRTGTVGHGFSYDSVKDKMKIDVMEWRDNEAATEAEFFDFLARLRDYFGKEENGVGSYETASDETYIWTDDQHSSYVGCWYDNGVINMRWNYNESINEEHTIGITDTLQETIFSPTEEIKLVDEVNIPDLPTDFLEYSKFIGEDISVFGMDTSNWDLTGKIAFEIGTASLYDNYGSVSFYFGWDKRTITGFSLLFDTKNHQYIQGDEYNEVSQKLEAIYGEPKRICDGITDFSGNGDFGFRLMRNGAGLCWNTELTEEFNNRNPAKRQPAQPEPTEKPIVKVAPYIGMTAEQVKESTWGKPSEINKTTNLYGVHEQWVYRGYSKDRYIYLDDGIVTSIQE